MSSAIARTEDFSALPFCSFCLGRALRLKVISCRLKRLSADVTQTIRMPTEDLRTTIHNYV